MVREVAQGPENSHSMGKNPRRGQRDDHGARFAQFKRGSTFGTLLILLQFFPCRAFAHCLPELLQWLV